MAYRANLIPWNKLVSLGYAWSFPQWYDILKKRKKKRVRTSRTKKKEKKGANKKNYMNFDNPAFSLVRALSVGFASVTFWSI